MRRILDAKYQKSYLSKIVSDSEYLNNDEHVMLYCVLTKNEFLFDGTLIAYKNKSVYIEIQPLSNHIIQNHNQFLDHMRPSFVNNSAQGT